MVEGENKKEECRMWKFFYPGTVLEGLCKVRRVWARCHFDLCCR